MRAPGYIHVCNVHVRVHTLYHDPVRINVCDRGRIDYRVLDDLVHVRSHNSIRVFVRVPIRVLVRVIVRVLVVLLRVCCSCL